MNIVVVGLSHKTAPVEFRERLSISNNKMGDTIRELCNYPHIEEVAILSTCNRLEIYLFTSGNYPALREVTQFLADSSNLSINQLREHLFMLLQQDAVMHLMKVTAGLDSLILGEGQILSQVKHAYQIGQQYQGIGPILNHLFKQAISAGKRVRTETQLSTGAVSISSAAVELAQIKKKSLQGSKVTIIGAGKMARLIVQHLLSKNVFDITIINRSVERAQFLADQFQNANIKVYSLNEMLQEITDSDIVFTSTSAQEPFLDRINLSTINLKSSGLMLFDISVPRNIHPNSTELENVQLFNVDDLKLVVLHNQQSRKRLVKSAERLLEEQLIAFTIWWSSLETIPTIKKLREKAETIRIEELDKARSRLGSQFGTQHQEVVEALTRGIVNKILHDPMVKLRAQQDVEAKGRALKILQNLFNLESMKSIIPPEI
uniref:Glutamyl-tRNA reductase n=1 Tax=Glaucocystis incrassata TaxID=1789788 RepID=A0A3G1IVE9_9EUKA|nr:glutamyl-tRNA reductase [Glaucocystis incrassata]ASQ40036.1 glutamyl-tRNA reductase [Glaucocystis incrassata]